MPDVARIVQVVAAFQRELRQFGEPGQRLAPCWSDAAVVRPQLPACQTRVFARVDPGQNRPLAPLHPRQVVRHQVGKTLSRAAQQFRVVRQPGEFRESG